MFDRRHIVKGLGGLATSLVVPRSGFSQQLREVSIGLSSASFASAAPLIAKDLGLFEAQGISGKLVVFDSGNASVAGLVSKSVDSIVTGSGDVLAAVARGQDIVWLGSVYKGLSTTMVISKAAAARLAVSPTAGFADRFKASNGLLVAAPSATSGSLVAFRGAAAQFGSTFRFTYMPQALMPAALETGAIDGFLASAPFWAPPVVKGTEIVWISGPKGELPPENRPVTTSQLHVRREFAEADPDRAKRLWSAFAEVRKAIEEKPAQVKEALARRYPDLDRAAFELIYASESEAWKPEPLKVSDVEHEIEFVKLGGGNIPGLDKLNPRRILFP